MRPETRGLCWTWGPPGQACTSVLRSDGSVYRMPCPLCAGPLPLQLALSWFAHHSAPHVVGSRAAQGNSLHGCLAHKVGGKARVPQPNTSRAPHALVQPAQRSGPRVPGRIGSQKEIQLPQKETNVGARVGRQKFDSTWKSLT